MTVIRRIVGLALVAGGIVLLVFAHNASHSMSSDISRVFTGNPTDRVMWLMVGGIVCLVAGLGATLLPGKWFRR